MKARGAAAVMAICLAGIAWQALGKADSREPSLPGQEPPPAPDRLRATADRSLPVYRLRGGVSGRLRSFGSDTMDDLMKSWIAGFTGLDPQVTIDLKSKASLTVPASLIAGAADMAPLSREMNPSEIQAFASRYGYAPTAIKVALGSYRTPARTVALTFYVNDANPVTELDFAQLDAMWCRERKRGYGEEITRWGQLGAKGEWADRPIHLVGVLPPDGVPNFISQRICQGGTFRDGIEQEKNGGPVSVLTRIVEDVAKDPDAIGYAGFHNRQPGTKQVLIAEDAHGPFLRGSFDEVRQARYPLTRYVYLYINRAPGQPTNPALREFLSYVLSYQGQREVEKEGIFMPLPERMASEERAKLE